jgi:RNA polymerase sigma-70 factor (ECF subfamily)
MGRRNRNRKEFNAQHKQTDDLTARSNEELRRRWLAGDEQAWNELFGHYYAELYKAALRIFWDHAAAHDSANEAIRRLLQQWKAGTEIDNPLAWMIRVAQNLARDYRKSAARRLRPCDPQTMRDLTSPGPMPGEDAEADEQKQKQLKKLPQFLATLSPAERRAVELHYGCGLSTYEIAEVMAREFAGVKGLSKSALHRKLPNLLAWLHKLLAALDDPDINPGLAPAR